jgi:hypothetical protein
VTAIERKYLRKMKRELKARAYRAVALAGGGKREVERRAPRAFNQFYWDAKRVMV